METLIWIGLGWLILRGRANRALPDGHIGKRNPVQAGIIASNFLNNRRRATLRVPGNISTGVSAGKARSGAGGGTAGGGGSGGGGKEQFTP